MSRKIIRASGAPPPIGPYNQAVRVEGALVFVAAQIGIDLKTGVLVPGDIKAQTRQVLTSVAAILHAAGSNMEKVIKTTVYLKDMNDFPAMNEVYAEFFPPATAPARATVEVARLPKDARVEIDAVAEA